MQIYFLVETQVCTRGGYGARSGRKADRYFTSFEIIRVSQIQNLAVKISREREQHAFHNISCDICDVHP